MAGDRDLFERNIFDVSAYGVDEWEWMREQGIDLSDAALAKLIGFNDEPTDESTAESKDEPKDEPNDEPTTFSAIAIAEDPFVFFNAHHLSTYSFIIDPTNMSPIEALMVTQFLIHELHTYGEILTEKDTSYECTFNFQGTDEQLDVSLEFTHDLAWYLDDENPEQDCFAVVSNTCIGKGSSCDVSKVKGRLLPSTTGTLFYQSDKYKPKDQRWVARYETHNDHLTADKAVEVFEWTKGNRNLGLKHPMWTEIHDETREYGMSVSIMRRLKDYDLETVLSIEEEEPGYLDEVLKTNFRWDLREITILIGMGKLHFSNLDLLRYSHATAIAYKEQVQDLGLMHRDIKSENAMLDLAKGPVPSAITFFDFSFARPLGMDDGIILCGTPGYLAPEMMKCKNSTSNKCDIYSLGCLLAQWFGDESAYDEFPESDPVGYLQACNRQFRLAQDTPQEIEILLYQMVARHPDDRPKIDEIIKEFQEVIIREELGQQLGISSSPSAKKGQRC